MESKLIKTVGISKVYLKLISKRIYFKISNKSFHIVNYLIPYYFICQKPLTSLNIVF